MKKNLYQSLRRMALAAAALSLCCSLSGCSQPEEQHGTIAVICKAQGVQFWDAVKKGAEDGGTELNYNIVYQATANDTMISEQIKLVETAVSDKVDAIIIAPNDVDALNTTLDKAVSNGIPVITIDSDVSYDGRLSYIGSDNTAAGAVAARAVMTEVPDGGEIAIIGHVEKSQTAIERISGFKDELSRQEVLVDVPVDAGAGEKKTAKVSDSKYHVVATQYCDNDLETAKLQTTAIIKNHPEVKLIYGTNENSTTGICDAVAELGKTGEIKVIGFNASDKEVAYIQDGTLCGTIVQNPYNMGYLGVKYAASAAKGETASLQSEMITSVTLVTNENLNNEDIRFLINPVSD